MDISNISRRLERIADLHDSMQTNKEDGEGHWITLNDGRHVFIGGAAGEDKNPWKQSERDIYKENRETCSKYQRATLSGINNEEYNKRRAAADVAIKNIVKNSELRVRVPSELLPEIIEDGRLQSQFESGRSRGLFSPEKRSAAESALFGYEWGMPEADRPIYGYLGNIGGDPLNEEHMAVAYGDAVIVLKDSVKERATFCHGDSLAEYSQQMGVGDMTPIPFEAPAVEGVEVNYWDKIVGKTAPDGLHSYTEAQMHGRVTLDDIDHIIIDDTTSESVVESIKKSGIKFKQEGWSVTA